MPVVWTRATRPRFFDSAFAVGTEEEEPNVKSRGRVARVHTDSKLIATICWIFSSPKLRRLNVLFRAQCYFLCVDCRHPGFSSSFERSGSDVFGFFSEGPRLTTARRACVPAAF